MNSCWKMKIQVQILVLNSVAVVVSVIFVDGSDIVVVIAFNTVASIKGCMLYILFKKSKINHLQCAYKEKLIIIKGNGSFHSVVVMVRPADDESCHKCVVYFFVC